MIFKTSKTIVVDPATGLYKWAKIFNRLQRSFFQEHYQLRREKQINDFIRLNGYYYVHYIKDTDIFLDKVSCDLDQAEIIVITDQKFSRYNCPTIIEHIKQYLNHAQLYLCLNRHYINIDNTYHDLELSLDFTLAITQWLKKSLQADVIDLSLDYTDYGNAFTWAIPDRHYLIRKKNV